MDIAGLVSVSVLVIGVGIVLGRYVWPVVRRSDRDALIKAQTEVPRLTERIAGLTKNIEEQANQTRSIGTQRDAVARDATAALSEAARLKERENALTQQIDTQKRQLGDLQEQLTTEFEKFSHGCWWRSQPILRPQ